MTSNSPLWPAWAFEPPLVGRGRVLFISSKRYPISWEAHHHGVTPAQHLVRGEAVSARYSNRMSLPACVAPAPALHICVTTRSARATISLRNTSFACRRSRVAFSKIVKNQLFHLGLGLCLRSFLLLAWLATCVYVRGPSLEGLLV